MAYFTALVTLGLSKMVAAIGSSCKLFTCTRDFHLADIMGIAIGGGILNSLMGVTVGMLASNAGETGMLGGSMCFPFMETGSSHNKFSSSIFCSIAVMSSSDC